MYSKSPKGAPDPLRAHRTGATARRACSMTTARAVKECGASTRYSKVPKGAPDPLRAQRNGATARQACSRTTARVVKECGAEGEYDVLEGA